MTLYKPIKGKILNPKEIVVLTETGHKVTFTQNVNVSIDLDNKTEDGRPFFFVTFEQIYINTKDHKKPLTLKQIKRKYKKNNLLTPSMDYDHVQIGFVYNDSDPNNHKWMLNFMDVSNNFLFGYNGEEINIDCPFTTKSWQDGVWHGRFVVYKKDIESLTEPVSGYFILTGKGDIGDHNVTPIKEGIDTISLRYNIYEDNWYCEYMKNGESVGKTPCKDIICDVPFVGKVDMSTQKPKVTAELNTKDVKGVAIALNSLIIKKR